MTPLSPAAQAIWDAWNDAYEAQGPLEDMGQPIAAALRAAADQVVPQTPTSKYQEDYESGAREAKHDARTEFLAIAAELEGQQ